MQLVIFFFFNDTATTEIYTLSLHDALPICEVLEDKPRTDPKRRGPLADRRLQVDRKSTRLNSSHSQISYAVFCLKKKTKNLCHGRTGVGVILLASSKTPKSVVVNMKSW